MSRIRDLFITYDLIKRLARPFTEMEAYERGIIDEKGNFLKKRSQFTKEDKQEVTPLDTVIINIKRAAGRFLPGRLATYSAALLLLKEHELEEMDDMQLQETQTTIIENVVLMEEEGGATDGSSSPSNNASDGDINLDPVVRRSKHSITFSAKKNMFDRCVRGKCKKERFNEYIDDEQLLDAVRDYAKKHPYNSIILQDEESGSRVFLKYGRNGSYGIPPRS